mmetsp:Transcript_73229/g.212063  ORF Transcript_73229/g.212063 Transcript_73229/m.212063 type:complete len:241 (+) Transcript_73229:280-1002(+)
MTAFPTFDSNLNFGLTMDSLAARCALSFIPRENLGDALLNGDKCEKECPRLSATGADPGVPPTDGCLPRKRRADRPSAAASALVAPPCGVVGAGVPPTAAVLRPRWIFGGRPRALPVPTALAAVAVLAAPPSGNAEGAGLVGAAGLLDVAVSSASASSEDSSSTVPMKSLFLIFAIVRPLLAVSATGTSAASTLEMAPLTLAIKTSSTSCCLYSSISASYRNFSWLCISWYFMRSSSGSA